MICGENMKLYDLPQNWKWISVRNMVSQDRPVLKAGPFGSLLKKSDYTLSGFRVYGQEQVIAGDLKIGNYYISEKKFKSLESCSVKSGDILMSLVGSFGKTLIVPDEFEPGIINPRLLRISLDSEKFNPDFFCYFVQSRFAQTQINLMSHGGTMGILNAKNVGELLLPVPPIAQQKRIAAILDKADAVRRKRREAIRLTEELLRSTFLEMFGDPITNPQGWKTCQLSSVSAKIIDCPHSTPKWTDNGIICIRTSNLGVGEWLWEDTRYVTNEDYLNRVSRSKIQSGDIILSREGTIGVGAIVESNMKICMGQRLVQVRPNLNEVLSSYLLYFLLWNLDPNRISNLTKGSTSKHINVQDLRNMKVMVPSLESQKIFEQFICKAKEIIEQSKLSLRESENLFNSLLQRAFTGDL